MATSSSQVLDYLGSPKNLVGAGLAVAAAGVTIFTGAAGSLWPAVVAASYGLGAVLTPGRRRIAGKPSFDHPYSADDLSSALDDDERLAPRELRDATAAVVGPLREVVARWNKVEQSGQVAMDVTATILDYLPTTLNNYNALSKYLRAQKLGATQHQLAMLADYASQARDAAYADDLRALEAQGAFLQGKWRTSSLDL